MSETPKTSPNKLAYIKRYKAEHRDAVNAYQREYYHKNKDKMRERQKKYDERKCELRKALTVLRHIDTAIFV